MMPPPTGGISTGGMPGRTKGKSKSCPWGAGSVLKKAKQAIKDFVYKMCLIDWSSKLSLCIPEETMGIITILMPPGSTVHDLKEKIMQWLEEISKEYGWNPPEGQLTILTSAAPPPRVLGGGDDTTPLPGHVHGAAFTANGGATPLVEVEPIGRCESHDLEPLLPWYPGGHGTGGGRPGADFEEGARRLAAVCLFDVRPPRRARSKQLSDISAAID